MTAVIRTGPGLERSSSAQTSKMEAMGDDCLDSDEPVFVLISRSYDILDTVLNMGIEEHLNAIGCKVVHLEHLKASHVDVGNDYPEMYWPFGQHIITGLKLVKAHRNMYPIYITNHACGPDTALLHLVQREMEGREYLHLEVDEHTSKIGVITRLEAFLYSLQPQAAATDVSKPSVSDADADLARFDRVLIPDYGIYSDLIEKYVRKEMAAVGVIDIASIERVQPLAEHRTFEYAMNKEYFTMLVMLEELLNTVRKGVSYVMVAPVDEGSEVFGLYALLCTQELVRRGYDVTLRPFYVEDLVKREDHLEVFRDMLDAEMGQVHTDSISASRRFFVMGEPLCVCKPYILKRNLAAADADMIFMPLSELLLFHIMETDRERKYSREIRQWQKMHDRAMVTDAGRRLYTSVKKLLSAAEDRLNFCMGDGGRYRFAKMFCLSKEEADAAVVINSAEEDTAIILKQMIDSYRGELLIPSIQADLDFEHTMDREDFELAG